MKLNKRLQQIAKLIRPGSIVVDLGCDHGFLSIYLIKNKLASYVYASDVNQEPLASAQSNIKKHRVSAQVATVHSDGLSKFYDIDFDTLVIAGMGGSLIVEILDKHLALIKDKHLILQPNVNDSGLRKYLVANQFEIINDYLVVDNNIIYDIIEVAHSHDFKSKTQEWNNLDYLVGHYNLKRNDELTKEKISKLFDKYQRLCNEIPSSNPKYQEVTKTFQELAVIKNELK